MITKVPPGTTVQHFWASWPQKCCTVALFREKTFKSFGLAAFLRSFSQPNRGFERILVLKARHYSTFSVFGGGAGGRGVGPVGGI